MVTRPSKDDALVGDYLDRREKLSVAAQGRTPDALSVLPLIGGQSSPFFSAKLGIISPRDEKRDEMRQVPSLQRASSALDPRQAPDLLLGELPTASL